MRIYGVSNAWSQPSHSAHRWNPRRGQPVVAGDRRVDHLVTGRVLLPRSDTRHQPRGVLRAGPLKRTALVCEHPRARVRPRHRRATARHRSGRDRPVAARRCLAYARRGTRPTRRAALRPGRSSRHSGHRRLLRGDGAAVAVLHAGGCSCGPRSPGSGVLWSSTPTADPSGWSRSPTYSAHYAPTSSPAPTIADPRTPPPVDAFPSGLRLGEVRTER
jgi:hypothetical protein